MLHAMRRFVEEVAADDDVRALVLVGEGKGFCAGEDVRGFDFPDIETAERFLDGPLDLFAALERLPKPVCVAVHGFAFGFGSEVLLVADSVHAAPGTLFGYAEIDHGLVPSVLVTRGLGVVFRRRALDLALTGRRFGVEEALALRVVHEVNDDPRASAEGAAREMAQWAPEPVALVKGVLGGHAVDDHARTREFMPQVLTQVAVSI
jgi:enoyl-CoA hydratase/carnithine racemase